MRLQKSLQVAAGAPVAGKLPILPYDKPFQMNSGRFHVFRVDSGIADERIGHCDDLSLVGRVGQDFLIAGHSRVEDDLAQNLALSGKGVTPVNISVLQNQQSRFIFALRKWLHHSIGR